MKYDTDDNTDSSDDGVAGHGKARKRRDRHAAPGRARREETRADARVHEHDDQADVQTEEVELARGGSGRARHDHAAASMEAALRESPGVAMWLMEPLDREAAVSLGRLLHLPSFTRLAIMPDVHPAADVCVGTVLATSEVVYPQAIGGDIGCGMAAVRLDGVDATELTTTDRERVLERFKREIDILTVRRRRAASVQVASGPDPEELSSTALRGTARRDGQIQLGTLGRGNHFLELQRDEHGALWLMVHSGSRAMGQAVASVYTRLAQREGVRASLVGLPRTSDAGASYVHDQEWCVRYARENRRVLLGNAAAAIATVVRCRPDWRSLLDVPHNLVRVEEVEGAELLVHRKGAAPAAAGQAGLIPGSAGTRSVHVEGRGEARSICSSSHGAGRTKSRREAKDSFVTGDLRRQMSGVTFDEELASSLRSEAPRAYRDLREVLRAQTDLIKITRTLTPLVSFKAGG
jgi:tRNA-splicing ligase RtcB